MQLIYLALLLGAIQAATAVCVGLPAPVTNAAWPSSCRNASTNVQCTAVCRSGYGGPVPTVSTCNADGTWSAVAGRCFKVCEGLPPPMNGYSWAGCDSSVAPGQRCTGSCTGGLSGNPSIMCSNTGWDVSTMVGRCVSGPVCPGIPARIINGKWPSSCMDTPSGQTCVAVCNDGYGSGVSASCTGSAWATPTGACARVCPDPPPFEAGITWPASCAGGTVTGQRCQGSCTGGMTGNPTIGCVGGVWNLATRVGKCVMGPSCGTMPPATVNAVWPATCIDTPAGQSCQASCRAGYGPGATASCGSNGAWSVTGMCSRVCSEVPVTPSLPNVNWANCVNTRVGRTCVGTCTGGLNGGPTITCTGAGWSVASVAGKCVSGPVCSLPFPEVINGRWPTSCLDTPAGQSCTATCNVGYGGGATVSCTAGVWGAVSGSCTKVCTEVPTVPGVTATWANCANTPVGKWCTGTCTGGLTGIPMVPCTGQGWEPASVLGICASGPVCTAPMPALINGQWPPACTNTPSNQACTAVCNAGYGPGATVTCINGAWGPVDGSCSKVCSSVPVTPSVPNANWANCVNTRVGRTCTGTCSGGLSGSPTITCTGAGWEVTSVIGKCMSGPVCSAPFPLLVNGRWPDSCLDSSSGSSCTAVCNAGYESPGASTMCTMGTWGPVVGGCNQATPASVVP